MTTDRQPWRDELRALLRLAVPVALSQLGMMLLAVVDIAMLGRLEGEYGAAEALAAVNLGHTYAFALMILATGAILVLDPVVAQAYAAREPERVAAAFHRGCVMAIAFSVLVGAAIAAGGPLIETLSAGSPAAPLAFDYAYYLIPSLPAYFLFSVVRQTLQAMSVTRPLVVAVIVANMVNVFLDYALIFGEFGAPALGVKGAAIATTICRYVMLLVLVFAALPVLRPVLRRPDRSVLALRSYSPLLGKGLQIGFQTALEVWLFNTVGILMVRMGTVESAGHTIALNLASLAFMIPLGIGAAAATRVGNAVGRADAPAARLAARVALGTGAAVMVVFSGIFLAVPRLFVALYTADAAVIAMAATLLPIAGVFQVFDGVQAVGCGILRGIADTRAAAIINFIGFWILGLPTGVLLAHGLGYGPAGLWWGLVVGLLAVAAMLVHRVQVKIGRATAIVRFTG
jgi:MATE family multidrug resistance protein